MNALIIALRYLQQHKTRSVLTALAIMFGVAVIYGTNAMLPTMQAALENATIAADDAQVTIRTGTNFNARNFDLAEDVPALLALDSVEAVAGRAALWQSFTVPGHDFSFGADVTGIDPTAEDASAFSLDAGRALQPGDEHKVIVTYWFAQVTGLGVGDSLAVFNDGTPYEIIGVMSADVDSANMYVPLDEAQAAFGMGTGVNRLLLTVSPDVPVMQLVSDLDAQFGSGGYQFEGGVNLSNAAMSNAVLAVIFNVFAGLALFVGAYLIHVTFNTAVIERKRDLAMLRAIGAERGQVTRIMTLEALAQGVVGTVAGILIGQVLAIVLLNLMWSTSYRGFAPPTGIPLHLPSLVVAVLIGLLTALLAGYFPARVAGRVSPLEALRPQTGIEVRRVALLRVLAGVVALAIGGALLLAQDRWSGLAIIGLLLGMVLLVPVLITPLIRLLLPVVGRIFPRVADVIRASVIRQPWRTSATVNLLAVGFAVFIGVMALIAPVLQNTEDMVNRHSPDADLALIDQQAPSSMDGDMVARLRDLPNIARLTTLHRTIMSAGDVDITLVGLDPAQGTRMRITSIMNEQSASTTFMSSDEADALVRRLGEGPYALISRDMAVYGNLEIGDSVTLDTPIGPQTYEVIGINAEFNVETNNRVVTVGYAPELFAGADIWQVILGFGDAEQAASTRAEITNTILVDYPGVFADDIAGRRAQMIGDAQRGMSIFYVMAALVLIPSVLGLINTLAMSVLERTREIGLLRATGADRGQVRASIMGEGLLLGLLSAVVGISAGLGIGYGIISSMNAISEGRTMYEFQIPLLSFSLALIAGLGLILLATLIPARRATRLDILRALRYE